MPYLDEYYSPEEQPAAQRLPESDFFGRGSAITEHIASTPGLAREMRYSPSNAWNQAAQDYLGPLAAQDFAAEAVRTGEPGGVAASLGSPAYVALKAVAPETASRWLGTGEAAPSRASVDQILRAYRGLGTAGGEVSPGEVRAALAARQSPEALQREVVAAQVPLTAGRVSWDAEPSWWEAGGSFKPQDLLPVAAAALGGAGALAGSGARAIAPIAARGAPTAATGAAEQMFAPAAQAGRSALDIPVGAASAGAGNAAVGAASGPLTDLAAWIMRQRGLGMEFPPATQAHPAYRSGRR